MTSAATSAPASGAMTYASTSSRRLHSVRSTRPRDGDHSRRPFTERRAALVKAVSAQPFWRPANPIRARDSGRASRAPAERPSTPLPPSIMMSRRSAGRGSPTRERRAGFRRRGSGSGKACRWHGGSGERGSRRGRIRNEIVVLLTASTSCARSRRYGHRRSPIFGPGSYSF